MQFPELNKNSINVSGVPKEMSSHQRVIKCLKFDLVINNSSFYFRPLCRAPSMLGLTLLSSSMLYAVSFPIVCSENS